MRLVAIAALAALSLAACNSNSPVPAGSNARPPAAAPSPLGAATFPDLFGASYREEGTMTLGGRAVPFVTYRTGRKMRVEMQTPNGQNISILDPDAHLMIGVITVNGQQMGMRMAESTFPDVTAEWRKLAEQAHRSGDCRVAGEHGDVWEHTDPGGANPRSLCVTSDGVLLRATSNGATTWEATVVQRGPQSDELFQAPPGVRVMELGPGASAALAAQMRRKPDQN